jgi:hypothetical protein
MSQIINPERRDPSFLKNKADVGLSKVDNLSASEIQNMIYSSLREEYSRGEIYGQSKIQNHEAFLIPLCKFKDKSSRATITIGFLDKDNEVVSFLSAKIKYSYEISAEEIKKTGISNLSVEFETSINRRKLFGSFKVYEESEFSSLYLDLPSTLSVRGISGITVNITDELMSSIGTEVFKSIERLNHSNLRSPEEFSNISVKDVVELNESDRVLSSFSRSLAIYNKTDGKLIYPDNLNGEIINSEDTRYDFPTINEVKFTGDSQVKVDGEDLRHITISAKHKSSDREGSGSHDWEVLDNIPKVSYNESNLAISTTASDIDRDRLGLCKLSDVPSLSEDTVNLGQSIANLQELLGDNSIDNESQVVSIKLLRAYTDQLRRIFDLIGGNSGSGMFYFYENEVDANDYSKNSLSHLEIYPQKGAERIFKVVCKSQEEELLLQIQDPDIIKFPDGIELAFSPQIDTDWNIQEFILKTENNLRYNKYNQFNSILEIVKGSSTAKTVIGQISSKLPTLNPQSVFCLNNKICPVICTRVGVVKSNGDIDWGVLKDYDFLDKINSSLMSSSAGDNELIQEIILPPIESNIVIEGYSILRFSELKAGPNSDNITITWPNNSGEDDKISTIPSTGSTDFKDILRNNFLKENIEKSLHRFLINIPITSIPEIKNVDDKKGYAGDIELFSSDDNEDPYLTLNILIRPPHLKPKTTPDSLKLVVTYEDYNKLEAYWTISKDLGILNFSNPSSTYNNKLVPIEYKIPGLEKTGSSNLRLVAANSIVKSGLELSGYSSWEKINNVSGSKISFWNSNDYFYSSENEDKYPEALFPAENYSVTDIEISGRTFIGDVSISLIPTNKYWCDLGTTPDNSDLYYTEPTITINEEDRVIVVKCPYCDTKDNNITELVNLSRISTLKMTVKPKYGSDEGINIKGVLNGQTIISSSDDTWTYYGDVSDRVSIGKNQYLTDKGIAHVGYHEKTILFTLTKGSEPVYIKRNSSTNAPENKISYKLIFAIVYQTASITPGGSIINKPGMDTDIDINNPEIIK